MPKVQTRIVLLQAIVLVVSDTECVGAVRAPPPTDGPTVRNLFNRLRSPFSGKTLAFMCLPGGAAAFDGRELGEAGGDARVERRGCAVGTVVEPRFGVKGDGPALSAAVG